MSRVYVLLIMIIILCLSCDILTGIDAENSFKESEKIVFSYVINDKYEIFSMDINGSNKIKLTNSQSTNLFGCVYPSWSPDRKKIVYLAGYKEGYKSLYDIYIMNADGSEKIKITQTSGEYKDPSWSPDGNKILFTKIEDVYSNNIYTINVDGSGLFKVTESLTSATQFMKHDNPEWYPDSDNIIFRSDYGSYSVIYKINKNGSDLEQITRFGWETIKYPTVSPDGKTILCYGRYYDEYGLYFLNSSLSEPEKVPNTEDLRYIMDPIWSPDGKKIMLVTRFQDPNIIDLDAYNMLEIDINGTSERILASEKYLNIGDWK